MTEEQFLKLYLNDISQYPLLTIEEEHELCDKIHNDDNEALDMLVRHNLKFVISLAIEYKKRCSASLYDLICEGNVGLVIAAKKYDYRKGAKFSTYAAWWIKHAMRNISYNEKYSPMRIPPTSLRKMRIAKNVKEDLQHNGNEDPSYKDISDNCNLSEYEVKKALINDYSIIRIDKQHDDNGDDFHFLLPQEKSEQYESDTIKYIIEEVMPKILDEREIDILKRRYGLLGNNDMGTTLQKIAKLHNLTRERIRQIQFQAIEKIRNYLGHHQNKK